MIRCNTSLTSALAVVADADELTDPQMAGFAHWISLSETIFLMRPVLPEADYRVRIISGLGVEPDRVFASQWADNGPGWVAVMLRSREEVLAIMPALPNG